MTIQKAIDSTPDYVQILNGRSKIKNSKKKPEQQQHPEIKFLFNDEYITANFLSDMGHFQKYENRKT